VWSELDDGPAGTYTNRKPFISSFRRNLQRTYLENLIGIALSEPGRGLNADSYAIARWTLKGLGERIDKVLGSSRGKLDDFSRAHFDDAKTRIDKALAAKFTAGGSRRGGTSVVIFGHEGAER